jgi:hypothetical protein
MTDEIINAKQWHQNIPPQGMLVKDRNGATHLVGSVRNGFARTPVSPLCDSDMIIDYIENLCEIKNYGYLAERKLNSCVTQSIAAPTKEALINYMEANDWGSREQFSMFLNAQLQFNDYYCDNNLQLVIKKVMLIGC